MSCVKICKAEPLMTQHGVRRIYAQNRTENGCQPDCKTIKMLSLNLATCQLATWAENAVKFKLTHRKKWNRKPNKNEVVMEWRQN